MNETDFETYQSRVFDGETVVSSDLNGTPFRVCGGPPPSSAAVLQLVLNILAGTFRRIRFCDFETDKGW